VTAPVGAAGATVATPSGKASLTIPAGALPSDTDITIERLDGQPVHGSLEGVVEAGGAYYKLSPDNQQFTTPVTFSVVLDGVVGDDGNGNPVIPAIAMLHVASDGTATPFDNPQVTIDADTGTATLSGELSHFSDMEFRIGRFGLLKVSDVPDEVAPGGTFRANVDISVSGAVGNALETVPVYGDVSIPPVRLLDAPTWVQTQVLDAQQNLETAFHAAAPRYQCDGNGGVGSYQAVVGVDAGPSKTWTVTSKNGVVKNIDAGFIVTRHLFQKVVSCNMGVVPEVGFLLPSDTSTAENGAYALAANLNYALGDDLIIPITFSGTATEGEDWVWNGERDGDGDPFITIGAGEMHAEAEYRILDDPDVEGDETIDFGINLTGIMPTGLVEVMPPFSFAFTLTDDPMEPTLGGSGGNSGMLFLVNPSEVIRFVGQSAEIELSEQVITVGADAQDIEVLIATGDPSIVGVPSLVPPGTSDGTTDVEFEPTAGLLVSRLRAFDLASITSNVQRVSFPCVGPGETVLEVVFLDLTYFPDSPTELAHTSVTVTCAAQEIGMWAGQLDLGYAPESFLGTIGPHAGTNNGPEGDPFADPQVVRHQALDVLDLPTDRDYALVADADHIGVWDLLDGTEVTRLAMPFGPYRGGTFLVAPESTEPPEWLVFYGGSGAYAESKYAPDGGTWGIVQFHPSTGTFVTDIVPGPLNENGHDTGYVVTDYGLNTVVVKKWNPSVNDWAAEPTYLRVRGAWGDDGGTAISAVGGFNGPALVLVDNNGPGSSTDLPGALWLFDPTEPFDDQHDMKVGSVGIVPNQLRCLRGVCVVTNFDSPGSITTVSWTAPGATPVVRGTQPVGDAPLGVDLIPDPAGGGVLALTTGQFDNSFTVTEIAADASVITSTTTPLTDCLSPGNARFTDGDGSHVMVACGGSDKVVIVAR
jgi:hypothetical protein